MTTPQNPAAPATGPSTEPTGPAPAPGTEAPSGSNGTDGTPQLPAWVTDPSKYDPQRAYETIQAQRTAEAKARDELAQARAKLAEYEQANMTELQKAQAQAKEQAELAAKSARELAVLQAAVKHGITQDDIRFLTGSTPEEIEASAAALAARLGGQQPGQQTPATPAPGNPSAGMPVFQNGVSQTAEEDLRKIIDALPHI